MPREALKGTWPSATTGARTIAAGGTQALLDLRKVCAGYGPARVLHDMELSVCRGETLVVIPTYTAMLEVRGLLARWAGQPAFWEEA